MQTRVLTRGRQSEDLLIDQDRAIERAVEDLVNEFDVQAQKRRGTPGMYTCVVVCVYIHAAFSPW